MKAAYENAEVISIWPQADMSVLNEGRRSPVAMPADLFGPAWPLLVTVAEGVCTAPDYPGMALLASCASLIGGKRRIRPYDTAAWSEPCILWCGAVGDPSSRKSPALDQITAPLRTLEQAKADDHKDALREFQERSEWNKQTRKRWQDEVAEAIKNGLDKPKMPEDAEDPEEPHRRRTLTMDSTPEALGAILQGNPQGVLSFRDELAGWLTSHERYSPGGREFWLEAYGGRPFVIDRKGTKGPISIPFNGVSVLGGIQPAKMADALLSSPDDGLVARFLWAWPDKVPSVRRPREAADLGRLQRAYERLDSLSWAKTAEGANIALTLPLAPPAADLFEAWQADNAAIDQDASALFKSFVGKMDGAVLRLALVGEFISWAFSDDPEPSEVSAYALAAAARFVDDYAKPMSERVYGDAALPAVERHAALLARYIRRYQFKTINLRTLKQSPHKSRLSALRQGDTMRAAAEYLVDAGWLQPAPRREGDTTGRTSLDFAVNPQVLEAE
ncbi:DUF3987 domain-containing protein [Altererythrobacter aurantiacus]|uniref:DUF3987 domain-containing protein n=2 Tax=Parapontixanthobacter aurantiacus TaxID=1463599 RepID=A0A844ZDD8_9SPHN|nr:DUF3987 domain-containing protein [Parapontixanthobacter aurantiacus]